MNEQRLNQAELAKALGKTKGYISQLKKSGKLVFDSDNKILYENALNQIAKHSERVNNLVNQSLNPDANSKSSENLDDDTLTYWKKENEKLANKVKQAEYDLMIRKMVDIEEVKSDANNTSIKLKNALLAMPDRISPMLAAEPDSLKIRELLNKEIKQILTDIANDLEQL